MKRKLKRIVALLFVVVFTVTAFGCGEVQMELPNPIEILFEPQSVEELKEYYQTSEIMDKDYLVINMETVSAAKVFGPETYVGIFETEAQKQRPDIVVGGSIYEPTLGDMISGCGEVRGYSESYQFDSFSYGIDYKNGELEFVRQRIKMKYMYKRMISVYCDGQLAIELFYYTTLSISQKYFEDFIKNNMIILKRS